MLAQGDFQKLLLAATEDRKKIFRKLFETETYYELQERLKEEANRLGREYENARQSVRQYIDGHLSEPLSRSVLAGLVFMNPDYFAKLFKEKTGQPLTAYIKRRRIEWAKELLAQTALPVSQVAQQVGYDNLSYFSSVLHDQTGLSPGEYRRQRKGK